MSELEDAIARLESAIARLDTAASSGRPPTVGDADREGLGETAAALAERIDAALTRLDLLLEREG